jgi:hypothetical protein
MKKLTLANAMIILGLAAIVTYLLIHLSHYGFVYIINPAR